MQIEIDSGSGFCFGVTTAIRKAEEELAKGTTLYCLGDIVHNGMECERLKQLGLITIDHEQMAELHDVKVLLRAHGEPPETYELARKNNIESGITSKSLMPRVPLSCSCKRKSSGNLKPEGLPSLSSASPAMQK